MCFYTRVLPIDLVIIPRLAVAFKNVKSVAELDSSEVAFKVSLDCIRLVENETKICESNYVYSVFSHLTY